MKSLQVILYVLVHHQHVSMVTMCPVMQICPRIWIFPHIHTHIYLLCLHIISLSHLHFLFLSHRNTFLSPTYLTLSLSLSFCLSHTQLSLSLSRFLSACHPLSVSYLRTKRLVSRQVLRPIKLSTPVVDLKDADTQSALGQRAQRYVVTERD